ncbi:MAG: histidine phosphatase family protein [Wenzhouxiangellaceae bacterium]|nr:histidine phosphatase family protein [Wenzhouxiangellaceae bacterium]
MSEPLRKLMLVRHAQGSLGTDDYDRLSALGFRQAECLGLHLDQRFAASPMVRGELKRHRQTADHFRTAGVCHIDADLNEYRVDYLLEAAYANADALAMSLPGPDAVADPVAYLDTFLEMFPDVLEAWQDERIQCGINGLWRVFSARVDAAGRRLVERTRESETIVAVSSAGVISTLAAGLLGHDLAWQRRLNVTLYNASVTELHWVEPGGWQLARINCVAHLPHAELHTLA